ncbi:MAG: bifunctional alpha,alpha-trehalose-phosphate synthase (UDP-forming)/trehalose-phosphatase [Candidatus Aureabacteria bacterium]|nr:bifunctional alpha,alpha-trehalose-phosphate synthase (UDP-forming)/trehalose-phosphatase [Candidatus Auribacterota bacterium]
MSNRLPVHIKTEANKYLFERSVGGLTTGLINLFKKMKGYWIGWPGINDIPNKDKSKIYNKLKKDYRYVPVFLRNDEFEGFYNGFSNSTIWPLFHYQSMHTTYDQSQWDTYKDVNKKFCKKILEYAGKKDVIWVHDYQLLLLPGMLRKALPEATIGFFLHIPFPSQELFRLIPWRQEVLEGMLGSDLIGFHTFDYTRHFLSCCLRLANRENEFGMMKVDNRPVYADTFPMGIDVKKFFDFRTKKNKPVLLNKDLAKKKIILSVDRLDISKGMLERLISFERFLEKYPQWIGKVTYILICSPSRTHILNYQILKKKLDELVGNINGRFSTFNWTPVNYIYQSVSQEGLIDLYRRAHVAFVTPLRDGMNLVAKEYLASRNDYKGVLILSEGAGACNELGEALIVNPNDVEQMADSLNNALMLPVDEQKKRNKIMITRLRRYDIYRWGEDFMETLIEKGKKGEQLTNIELTEPIMNRIVNQYKSAQRRVIFLDYDGTLVTSSRKNEKVLPNNEILKLLKKLSSVKSNRVVLVSRRNRKILRKWFSGCKYLDIVAEHGLWIYRHKENSWEPLEQHVDSEWQAHIRPILETYVDRTPGAYIEEKPHSLTWNYRKSDPALAEIRLREMTINLLSIVAGKNLEILRGNKVVGVKLNNISKGKAALRILEEESEADFMMAVGDDWTDEEMFASLPETCVTIKVKYEELSRAKYFTKSPKGILTLLDKIV